MMDRQLRVERAPLSTLVADPSNPRTHDDRNLRSIADSLRVHGQVEPLLVQARTRMVIAGNGRAEAMRSLGWTHAQVVVLDVDDKQARALSIKLNRTAELAGWDESVLRQHLRGLGAWADTGWEADLFGFTGDELVNLFSKLGTELSEPAGPDEPDEPVRAGGLIADWGAPPFSVLDTRRGYWRERRHWWKDIGLDPNIGRAHLGTTAGVSADYGSNRGDTEGGSTFDPVLAELLVAWFSAIGDRVLDPFAGGPCRGVVAGVLGRHYTGIDVRDDQVQVNRAHWQQLQPSLPALQRSVVRPDHQPEPQWITGDSREQAQLLPDGELYDAMITCPPYADLEVYSDDPRDISTMDYQQFIEVFGEIMAASVARLRPGCFAAIVMGEVRDRSGFLRGLIPDTIRFMEAAGARFYNDGILLNSAGSLPLRAGRQFRSGRKLGRVHQCVLVFVKGAPRCDLPDPILPAHSDPA